MKAKAEQMDSDKLIGYVMAACILVMLVSGIVELFKPKEPKDETIAIDLSRLPKGSVIVLPAEK